MIELLEISGFKRFLNRSFRLNQLTVLAGTNGGGKTTVNHALALLHAQAGQALRSVPLNGPMSLQLGETSDVLHPDRDTNAGIEMAVTLDGVRHAWRFGIADQERALSLGVVEGAMSPVGPIGGLGLAFQYLCAERLGPRDFLPVASSGGEALTLGVQGENVGQVLATLGLKPLEGALRLHPTTPDRGDVRTLVNQLEWWMSDIVRPVRVTARWHEGSGVTTVRYEPPGLAGQPTRPFNMGFGVTYALPVVLAGLVAPTGGLLIIENPEAHLHPAGQSAVGQFLARVAADGVQVIVETHSDHVLNGIRLAVADAILASELAKVLFFDSDASDEPVVTDVGFTVSGSLTDWPRRLFDQFQLDVAALSRRRGKRAQ